MSSGERLGAFLAHKSVQGLPALMETPGPDDHGPDAAEVQKLRDLHGRWVKRTSKKRGQVAGLICAITRKLGRSSGTSWNSGLRQPSSSPRLS